MKIDTTKPRLPVDRTERFKHPFRKPETEPDEPEDLTLAGKEGEELDEVVRRLYNQKIEIPK